VSTTNPPEISLNNISLSYQHTAIFKNFSFSFPAHQWTCLLGKSGVGKSTLLRFIAGLSTGCEGSSTPVSLQNKISYLPQQNALFPWLTVMDNISISLQLSLKENDKNKISSRKILKQEIISLLAQVGLKNVENLYPHQLSGGMAQRVALVRILFEKRPIILMDEPFSAVDFITRLKLQELAAQLFKQQTILLVTHDPLEALKLADQIYILSGNPAKISAPIIPNKSDALKLLAQQNQLISLLRDSDTADN
jgi:putative hydroxymethylpyrimidine transport system ATP-binding protein